ncbi:MAG: winged helix-turn-helix transcriptional regulator [Nitrososphaerales archaeon]
MDITNLNIMRILLANGRASYQTIGGELGLSGNTVKNRVMEMIDDGVIARFIAQIKLEAFGYDLIYVIISQGKEEDQMILDKMKLIGDIFMIINCVGGITILGIAVRGELDQKMELVKTLVRPAIITNIFSIRGVPAKKLLRTDLMLLRHLIKYPRAYSNDIAKVIRISSRTVKRRLDFLTKMDIARFSMIYNPAAMRGFIQFSLMLDIDEKKYNDVVDKIYRQLGDHFLLPPPPLYQKSMIVIILYSDNVYSMDEMFKTVKNIDGVKKVELSIPTKIDFKQHWFVKLIDKVLRKTKETNMIRQEDYILAK